MLDMIPQPESLKEMWSEEKHSTKNSLTIPMQEKREMQLKEPLELNIKLYKDIEMRRYEE